MLFLFITVLAETTESEFDDLLTTAVPENDSQADDWGAYDGMYSHVHRT